MTVQVLDSLPAMAFIQGTALCRPRSSFTSDLLVCGYK